MKIGAENKKQLYWMIALLAIAIFLAVYEFGGHRCDRVVAAVMSRVQECHPAGPPQTPA